MTGLIKDLSDEGIENLIASHRTLVANAIEMHDRHAPISRWLRELDIAIAIRRKRAALSMGHALTAAPLPVYRMIGPDAEPYRGVVMVHRAGAGCHKGMTRFAVEAGY